MSAPAGPLAEPLPWNLVADGYAAETLPQFIPFARAALAAAGVEAGHHVADVACGPGTLAFEAVACGATVRALDFSEAMLDQLRTRAAAAGVTGIAAEVGDGMALPWPEACVDAAFSMFGLIFFPERARGFAELLRVLRPGGRAVVSSWVPFDRAPAIAALFESLRAALPGLPFGNGQAPLGTLDEVRAEFEGAGFVDVQAFQHTHTIEVADAATFWDGMTRTMAPVTLLAHRLGPAWPETSARIFAELAGRLGEGPVVMEMTANLGVGTRSSGTG